MSAWASVVDAASGKTYYVNRDTKETSWTKPAGFAEVPASPVPAASSSASPWTSKVDQASGKTYYINKDTKETSWTKPAGFEDQHVSSGGASPAPIPVPASAPAPSPVTSPWSSKVDAASGKTYYVNRDTKETSWTKPAGFEGTQGSAQTTSGCLTPPATPPMTANGPEQGSGTGAAGPVAVNSSWAKRVDYKTGQTYYYHVVTGEVRWVDPSLLVAYLEMPLSAEAIFSFGGNERSKSAPQVAFESVSSCEMFDGQRWHFLQQPRGGSGTKKYPQPLNPGGTLVLPFDMDGVCAVRIGPSSALIMGKRSDNGAVYCAEWNSLTLESTLRHDLAGLYAAGCAYASVPHGIIACGGFLDDTMKVVANDAVLIDVSRSTPMLLPKLNIARASHSLVVVDASTPTRLHWIAYAVGGFDGSAKCAVVERYVLGENRWEIMQSMSAPRSGHCAVAHNRTVYVFGGRSGYRVTNTGEFMHVQTDTWAQTKPMRVPRASFGCVSLNPYIIVAGGWNGTEWVASVEAYDPRIDVWRDVAALPFPKSMLGLAVLTRRPDPTAVEAEVRK
jgi:hypothetical protein